MAIRVPQARQTIGVDTPRIITPPSVDNSGNLRALNANFEANQGIARATAGIGEALAKHAAEKIELENDKLDSQVYTQYTRDMQNRLYNDTPQTIKVNGQDITRPAGLMVRQLDEADGAGEEIDNYYYRTGRQEYLGQIKNPVHQAKVAAMMDNHFTSIRDDVFRHQAVQGRKALISSFDSSLKEQIATAYDAQTPESLKTSLINAGITQDSYNKAAGITGDAAKLAKQATYASLVENSVMGKLRATGDVNQANALLDSIGSENLGTKAYDDLKEQIAKSGNILEKQREEAIRIQTTSNRLDFANKVANGELKWDNSGNTIKTVMQSDPELAEAMKKVIDSQGNYEANEDKNEAFQTNTDDIFKAGTQEEISKYLIKAMNDSGNGKISRDRLAIIVNAAQNRAKSLPALNAKNSSLSPTQIAIDGGYQAARRWFDKYGDGDTSILNNYMSSINAGRPPLEAYQSSMEAAQIKKNPNRVKYSVGQLVNNGTGRTGKVVGYDEDGEPLIDLVK